MPEENSTPEANDQPAVPATVEAAAPPVTAPAEPPKANPPEVVAPAGEETDKAPPPRPRPPRATEAAAPAAEGATPAPRPRPGADAAPAKPLADYLKEDLQPLLQQRMQAEGAMDVQITTGDAELTATWDEGDKIFTLYFDEGSLEGRKTITSARSSSHGRDMQMFMPPERGFKGVDAKQIVTMILIQFTTTLTWIHKTPAGKAGAGKKPKK